jgi:phage-related protein
MPIIAQLVFGGNFKFLGLEFQVFDSPSDVSSALTFWGFILAGLFVGFGSRMGKGDTIGHVVCGIPRLAPQSLASVLTFCATGAFIATLRYHLPFADKGWSFGWLNNFQALWASWISSILVGIFAIYFIYTIIKKRDREFTKETLIIYALGLVFGFAIMLAGFLRMSKVRGLLTIDAQRWDPTLLFAFASACLMNFVTFNLIRKESPVFASNFSVPKLDEPLDKYSYWGSAIFGLGWGMSGLDPASGLINFFVMGQGIVFMLGMVLGHVTYDNLAKVRFEDIRTQD